MGRAGPSELMTGVARFIEGDNVISLTSNTRVTGDHPQLYTY